MLSIVLLVFTLARLLAAAGVARQEGLHDRDRQGRHRPAAAAAARASPSSAIAIAIPWALFTVAVYALILVGGFVQAASGRDYTPTLRPLPHRLPHRHRATAVWYFAGSAWNSLLRDPRRSRRIAAPLTAAIGLLTAYLLTRADLRRQARCSSSARCCRFAIPGTVIGVSYILAFNVPPIELTGTGLILVICFVFRNMPVGVRCRHRDAEPDRQVARRGLADARRALLHDDAPRDRCRCCGRRSSPRSSIPSCAP